MWTCNSDSPHSHNIMYQLPETHRYRYYYCNRLPGQGTSPTTKSRRQPTDPNFFHSEGWRLAPPEQADRQESTANCNCMGVVLTACHLPPTYLLALPTLLAFPFPYYSNTCQSRTSARLAGFRTRSFWVLTLVIHPSFPSLPLPLEYV